MLKISKLTLNIFRNVLNFRILLKGKISQIPKIMKYLGFNRKYQEVADQG